MKQAENAPLGLPANAIEIRELMRLGVGLLIVAAAVVSFRGVIPHVVALYPLELPPHPYLVPDHAFLLYVATPLVVLASIGLFLAPGIFFVLALGGAARLADLLLKGFVAAFIWYAIAISGLKLLAGPLEAGRVLLVMVAAAFLAWGVLAFRVRRGDVLPSPVAELADRRRLLWLVSIAVLLCVLLLPVLFWQDFNSDGFEELQFGSSLIDSILPLNVRQQIVTGAEGRVNVPFFISWFVLLFGPIEGAVHLPFVLDMLLLFPALVALIEFRAPRALRASEEGVVIMALAVYVVTVCYSAAYSPYFADLNVAASETLPVLCMIAAAYFLWAGSLTWGTLYGVMANLGRPTGLMFLVLFGLGVAVASRRADRLSNLRRTGAAVILILAVTLVYQALIVPWASGWNQPPMVVGGNAHRLAYLRLDDFRRVLWLLVPGGILPALALLAWRKQDPIGRSLTVVSACYFAFFYVIAFVALHHFLPVMLLPLVVFWRLVLHRPYRPRLIGLAAAMAGLALWLSLPRNFEVNRTIRRLARTVDYRIDDRQAFAVGKHPVDMREDLLFSLFPAEFSAADPSQELVIMTGPILYYSERLQGTPSEVNYIVQLSSEPPPEGFMKTVDDGLGAVYVRDLEHWRRDRFNPPRTDYRSPVYEVSRETLFRHLGRAARNYTIDLAALACRPPFRELAGSDLCSRAGY